MATAAQVNEFRRNTAALTKLALRDLDSIWAAIDVNDSLAVKRAVLQFVPDLVQTYGSTASLLGADFYDQLRNLPVSAGRFSALLAEPVPVKQAEAMARWGIGEVFKGNPAQALENLSGGVQRLVMEPARTTIARSASRDPVRTLWARIPGGGDTCNFCIMVASQGAVYASEESAGGMNDYHDRCECVPTPVRSNEDYPDGYDPDALYEQYSNPDASQEE